MIKIISEKLPRILKNKKRLEKTLGIKINNRGKEVTISGSPENEFIAEKVIDALNFGFSYPHAISIKEENFVFEILNIKDYTNQKNLERVRGRVIGKEGKAIKNLSELTESHIERNGNKFGIIANSENIKQITESIIHLIGGAKHGNVYKGLEKNKPSPIEDLGLREEEDKNL